MHGLKRSASINSASRWTGRPPRIARASRPPERMFRSRLRRLRAPMPVPICRRSRRWHPSRSKPRARIHSQQWPSRRQARRRPLLKSRAVPKSSRTVVPCGASQYSRRPKRISAVSGWWGAAHRETRAWRAAPTTARRARDPRKSPRGTTARPRWSRAGGPWRSSINLKDTEMNWDHIEGNWKQFKGNVKKQWGKLTDDQLDGIAGKRAALAGKIQEAYGVSKDEAEKQLADFQKRMQEIGHVK